MNRITPSANVGADRMYWRRAAGEIQCHFPAREDHNARCDPDWICLGRMLENAPGT